MVFEMLSSRWQRTLSCLELGSVIKAGDTATGVSDTNTCKKPKEAYDIIKAKNADMKIVWMKYSFESEADWMILLNRKSCLKAVLFSSDFN